MSEPPSLQRPLVSQASVPQARGFGTSIPKEAWRRNLPFQSPFRRPSALVPSVPEVLGFGAIRSEGGLVLELSFSKVLGFRLGVRHMFHRPW